MKYHARHAAPRDRRRSHTLAGALVLGVALSLVATPAYAGDIKPRRGEGAISMVSRECGSARGWQAIASAAGIRSSNGWLVLYGRTYNLDCKSTTRSSTRASRSSGWVHPLPGAPLTSCYGAGRGHQGIDLDGVMRQRVRSVGAGTVVRAGWDGGYGRELVISHGGKTWSQYAHLSGFAVRVGQRVSAGQTVAYVGNTGHVIAGPRGDGSHLHFEIRRGGIQSRVNPAPWLRSHGVSVGC